MKLNTFFLGQRTNTKIEFTAVTKTRQKSRKSPSTLTVTARSNNEINSIDKIEHVKNWKIKKNQYEVIKLVCMNQIQSFCIWLRLSQVDTNRQNIHYLTQLFIDRYMQATFALMTRLIRVRYKKPVFTISYHTCSTQIFTSTIVWF